MLFNSLSYAVFLPVVFIIYWLLPHRFRWILLFISSYYFYMSWNPKYVVLIFGTTLISYLAGIYIEKSEKKQTKKIIVIAAAVVCLGILFVFKYFNFAIESICSLFKIFSIPLHPFTLRLVLPVGISFYTFQTLSYVIDVYKGKIKAEKHLGYYATFVSFFPQLVAGPIERSSNLLPQVKTQKSFNYEQGVYGMRLMLIGFLKKVVIADTLSGYVDLVYNNLSDFSGFSLILVIFFFSVQIYCDFSGYSDIAIGTAKLFGIDLMTNFKSPYFSENIKEFWSRWHISLSTWFKDYVYIPLGGNRVSKIRHKANLLITFLISGLWHGANWTYIAWGGVHGIAQMFTGKIKKTKNKILRVLRIAVTFVFCNLAWVLFRAQSISDALYVYIHTFDGLSSGIKEYLYSGFSNIGFNVDTLLKMCIAITVIFTVDLISLKNDIIKEISEKPLWLRWVIYICISMIILFFMPLTKETQFIYFQF